jgi:undecaprenyl-phosphate 4-deoxy-4-formamido-L-arabinose transferase
VELQDVDISVVIPVYRSEDCLPELARRLTEALDPTGKTYEIILVNDGSPDRSWEKIVELAGGGYHIKGINLRRNFGQDNAIMAGFHHMSGRVVIVMDDDLQHDPKDIPRLVAEIEKGYDVCYARFRTKKQTRFKNFGSWLNDKVANVVIAKPKEVYLSPYKAIRREVTEQLIRYDGPYPYVDGLLFTVTHNIGQITTEHQERYAGRGNYNLAKSVRVWMRLATSFSVYPLRLAAVLGFLTAALGFGLAVFFTIRRFMVKAPLGWASTMVTVLFLGGVQLIALGVIGEYVGRLFLQHGTRPQFVVREDTSRAEAGPPERK